MVVPGSLAVNFRIVMIKEYNIALVANPDDPEIVFSGSHQSQAATPPMPYVVVLGTGGNLYSL
jgi:hypothetical protein